ncbi:type I 3-dehydroquinate dehydratase [Dehalogenimonas sp. 4OHTPN]|uniref:3-dehydroquinate dehydratase n=1 Tax=Dehalogenimonas sp. 4OHTPN TaxID=3166643 RepID=A0AAU8GBB5_9CHLR
MRPKICGVIAEDEARAIAAAEPLVDLFELRIDLVGQTWPAVAHTLTKPWIATNRPRAEGGRWDGGETDRQSELLKALSLSAAIVDVELAAPGLDILVGAVKKKARCLVSHHDFAATPPLEELEIIIERQIAAGADICKVVTTAASLDDNLKLLKLYAKFPGRKIIAFAMGPAGVLSRVLAPLAGAEFAYASLLGGKESAPGQLSAARFDEIYRLLQI